MVGGFTRRQLATGGLSPDLCFLVFCFGRRMARKPLPSNGGPLAETARATSTSVCDITHSFKGMRLLRPRDSALGSAGPSGNGRLSRPS